MKLGIFGAGMIVHDFLSMYQQVDDLKIVYICATPQEEEKLKELCVQYNIPKYYIDIDKAFSDSDADTCYIGVPNYLHYTFVKKALYVDRHVICEKPLTSNIKEANELADIAKKRGKILVEGVSTYYFPNMSHIKSLIPTLGDIKLVVINFSSYSTRYDRFKNGEMPPACSKKIRDRRSWRMFQMFKIGKLAEVFMENRWLICQILFAGYTVVLAVMDIKWKQLSLPVLLSGAFLTAAGLFCGREVSMILLAAGAGTGVIFLIISKVTDESFGYGDSILILFMGGFLGFWNILTVLLTAFSGAALFAAFMLIRKKFHRKSAFPFVPFLTLSYIGGMAVGMY